MLLELLQAKAPVGFGFVDRDCRMRRMNETLAGINGSTVAAQLGQFVADLVPALWPQLEPLYRRVLDRGEAVLDVEIDRPSAADPGRLHHWLTSYYPVVLETEVVGIAIVIVDVTGRVRAGATAAELAAIVGGSGDAIFGATTDGTVTSWNAAAEGLFGYTAAEIIGQPAAILAPTGQEQQQEQVRGRVRSGGPAERMETTRRCRDGSLVDVLMTTSPATQKSGKVVGFSVIAHDITARRGAQRALETSQRQLTEAQRIAGLGSLEFDLVTGQMTWSAGLYRLLGLDPGRGPDGDAYTAAVHPEDRPAATQAWVEATERGVPVEVDYRITRPDMQVRNVHTRAVPHVAADGTVIRLGATVLDDTERIQAERARRAAETRFETGFEQAGIGAAIVALDGVPARVNLALCALMGRPVEQLTGRLWSEYTHPDEVPLWQLMAARVAAGHDTYGAERRYLRPDATVVWASVNVTVVRDGSEQPQYFLAQYQDITARKQMEQELAHQALHDTLTGLPNRALLELFGTWQRGTLASRSPRLSWSQVAASLVSADR